jgi:hypothetical protein
LPAHFVNRKYAADGSRMGRIKSPVKRHPAAAFGINIPAMSMDAK